MGTYASVVIYPVGGRAPGRKRREIVARDMVRAFERAALLPPGTADAAEASPATHVVGCEDLPSDVEGVRLSIGGWGFLPGITDLIFAWTWAEYFEGLEPKFLKVKRLSSLFSRSLRSSFTRSRSARRTSMATSPSGPGPWSSSLSRTSESTWMSFTASVTKNTRCSGNLTQL